MSFYSHDQVGLEAKKKLPISEQLLRVSKKIIKSVF